MNKVMTIALLAGGLLLMNSPEAAAHKSVVNKHYSQTYHYEQHRRSQHMPYWLKRDKSFRHWLRQSSLQRDRRLTWHQLFEIYHWERRFGRTYYRSRDYWNDYYDDRERRHHKRHDKRHREDRRHRH